MRIQAIVDWLQTQRPDYEYTTGPKVPETPDRLVIITRTGGGPLMFDGAIDEPGFQVRVRGEQFDGNSAEDTAIDLDTLIIGSQMFDLPDGTPVLEIIRSGSTPEAVLVDDADRTTYTCNYVARVGSELPL